MRSTVWPTRDGTGPCSRSSSRESGLPTKTGRSRAATLKMLSPSGIRYFFFATFFFATFFLPVLVLARIASYWAMKSSTVI